MEIKSQNTFSSKGGRKFSTQYHRIESKRGNRYTVEGFPTQTFSTSELLPQNQLAPQVITRQPVYQIVNTDERAPITRTKLTQRIQSQFNREGLDQSPSTSSLARTNRKRKQVDHGVFIDTRYE